MSPFATCNRRVNWSTFAQANLAYDVVMLSPWLKNLGVPAPLLIRCFLNDQGARPDLPECLVPFKLTEGKDDHRIVVNQTRFRLGRNSTPKGSCFSRQTFQAHERSVSENVCPSLSHSSLSTAVWVEFPSRAYVARRPFLVAPSRSNRCRPRVVEGETDDVRATLRPRDSNRYGRLSFLYGAVVSRKWTLRHSVIFDNSWLEPFRWQTGWITVSLIYVC